MTVLPQTVLLTGVLIEFRENERNRKSARKYQEREEGKKKKLESSERLQQEFCPNTVAYCPLDVSP